MRLKEFWATLRRRWYLAVAALLIAMTVTFLVVVKVGPSYEAQGSVLVFPPVATVQRESQAETQGNPFLVLNGVSQARDIVIRSLTAKSTREQIAQDYPDATFEAVPDYTNSAPIILITADASTAESATGALSMIMTTVPTILNDLQASLNLPSDQVITSKPLIADQAPDAVRKGQIRAGIVAAVAALALCMLLIGLVDGLISGASTRKNTQGSRHGRQRADIDTDAPQDSTPKVVETNRRLGPRAPVSPGARRIASDDSVRRLRSVSGQN